MKDQSSEKQFLTLNISEEHEADVTMPKYSKQSFVGQEDLLDVRLYKNFESLTKDVIFNIEECYHHTQKIQEAQKEVFEHTIDESDIAYENRDLLKSHTAKAMERIEYISRALNLIEPSKPSLSNLDLRNQRFKLLLRSFKDLLEEYISIVLESQRFTSVLFESQIKKVNPHATPFDLERAVRSTGDDSPSMFVQVLMQRGVRKDDKWAQTIMHSVLEIQQDLKELSCAFTKLSKTRNETNLLIERYRRRWPVVLKEGEHVYVIDDNLNLLKQTLVGKHIDFEAILKQKERRSHILIGFISLIVLLFVIALVVFSTLFSEFYANRP
ncbi:hypothetical protein A0J61_00590 [Choanephora cucurbitarum]|uniref:Uncharacterized protein n=1 Tax=Choanephora cucurbitarum TaxID=101091 RepID=A0A1C7NQL4_9FUNG|nr:hypothetical protein A0J61_00590 [Choanephora cucurbitarum]